MSRLPQFSALPPGLFGGADLRGGGLRGIRRHGIAGRDQRRPPDSGAAADHPAPGDGHGGPHRPPHQHRHERFPAHERQFRAVFAVRGPHPQETPGRGLCGKGVGGAGEVDERGGDETG